MMARRELPACRFSHHGSKRFLNRKQRRKKNAIRMTGVFFGWMRTPAARVPLDAIAQREQRLKQSQTGISNPPWALATGTNEAIRKVRGR
jgi:hypothetical protein